MCRVTLIAPASVNMEPIYLTSLSYFCLKCLVELDRFKENQSPLSLLPASSCRPLISSSGCRSHGSLSWSEWWARSEISHLFHQSSTWLWSLEKLQNVCSINYTELMYSLLDHFHSRSFQITNKHRCHFHVFALMLSGSMAWLPATKNTQFIQQG